MDIDTYIHLVRLALFEKLENGIQPKFNISDSDIEYCYHYNKTVKEAVNQFCNIC